MKWFNGIVTKLSVWFAVFGGLILMFTAAVTIFSIFGRELFNLSVPAFDITKAAMGVVIASFLPYCILNGGNLIVDFFTTKTKPRTQAVLDTAGALLTGIGVAMLAWRGTVAIADVRSSSEVVGNLDLPVWWVYLAMAPSLWLAVAASLALAWRFWHGEHLDSEAELILKQAELDTLGGVLKGTK